MNRNGFARLADFDRDAVVFNQQTDLLGKIGTEKVGPRHGGFVHARSRDEAVGEARIEPRMGRSRDAHKRIGGAHARRQRLAVGIRLKTIAQEARIALIDIVKASHRRSGIGEGLGRDVPRGSYAQWGVHVV